MALPQAPGARYIENGKELTLPFLLRPRGACRTLSPPQATLSSLQGWTCPRAPERCEVAIRLIGVGLFRLDPRNGKPTCPVRDRDYGHPVCFSPEGDVAGGLVVTAIGIDTCRHLRGRKEYLLLAALPLVLGAHLLIESLVWWQLRGDIPHEVGRAATWLYLLIALVVVPVLVPVAVMMLEPTRRRRLTIAPFVVLGAAVAVVLLVTIVI